MKIPIPHLLVVLLTICIGSLQNTQAVSPAPGGCYPNYTTAEGCNALAALTAGTANTGVGWYSLFSNTAGNYNTGVGAGALALNSSDNNTAVGAAALLSNTTGTRNTAIGIGTLVYNITGSDNTAVGTLALQNNTDNYNTAVGHQALQSNTTGGFNTAVGGGALSSNTSGINNTALGNVAGSNVTTANNVICIGTLGSNVDNSCYIGNIFNATSSGGTAVYVNMSGRLGTSTSSKRFKEAIKPMEHASDALYALQPVTFRYKKEVDPEGAEGQSQFGLVAEDVEKVNPHLIVRDKQGKPYSVRYDQVNAMLLNEFLKEHTAFVEQQRKVERLEAIIAQQRSDFDAAVAQLTAQIQKVSAQLEVGKAAPRTVLNNQ